MLDSMMQNVSLLLAQSPNAQALLLLHGPAMLFVFLFGACVGSFINVVNYRMPARMSVIAPPSRCPTCGARLKFFRDNLPILGWLVLRGKCRYCGTRISPEYMLVELMMALLFIGLYMLLYWFEPHVEWWGEVGGSWWYYNSFFRTWPAFFAWALLIAGLFSMTVIDARTFMIPIEIPLFVTGAALVLYAVQALLPLSTRGAQTWPIQGVSWETLAICAGGVIGVGISSTLMMMGVLKPSFADYEKFITDDEPLADYPHARREMFVELRFLLPIIVGLAAGYFLGDLLPDNGPPRFLQAIGASIAGYFMGAALIWAIRILGTLGFGREAMGLGDVHLLGAVGAVLGWFDPILIFFIAPFSGLLWAMASMGVGIFWRGARRPLPYGPHLAVAALIMIVARPGIEDVWNMLFQHVVPWPAPGLA